MNILNQSVRVLTLIAAYSLFLVSGCGPGGAEDQPKLGSVTGKVTMDGAPLENATIRFYPPRGRASSAQTDSEGQYELVYLSGTKGAIIGEHVVRISTANDEEDPLGVQGSETVPAKYNKESTLTATVNEGENEINFELSSK